MIVAATPRKRADNNATKETAPPVKGAIEELDPPEPVPDADGVAVPAGELVVEAVGLGATAEVEAAVAFVEVATVEDDGALVVLAAVDAGAA